MNDSALFPSPQCFLDYLAKRLSKKQGVTAAGTKYDALSIERLKETRTSLPEDSRFAHYSEEDYRNYAPLIRILTDDLFEGMSEPLRSEIKANIAIGALETGEVNAAIYKNQYDQYCVLMDYGLFSFLNCLSKYSIAASIPGSIAYCEGSDRTNFSLEEINRWTMILIASYGLNRKIVGPSIILNDKALQLQGISLLCIEMFVLCHEIGHYINGDLEKGNFLPLLGIPDVLKYTSPKQHEAEYNADTAGFKLLVESYAKRMPGVTAEDLLTIISGFFNLMEMLPRSAHSSHPSPQERLINIAKSCFSSEFSAKYINNMAGPREHLE